MPKTKLTMYTLREINAIVNLKPGKSRNYRARYAIRRIEETIANYKKFVPPWPALYESMERDRVRLINIITP